jgi:transposase
MRTVGLDIGTRVAEIAINEDGRTRSGGRIAATPDDLRAFAQSLGPDDQVALEATLNTWPIVELLERHAGRVVVSNPLRTRAIAEAKTKTDRIDAATLAELLAADYLPAVWQPDPATRALRRRVAARASLVAERTRLRNRVSAVLARNLLVCPWTDLFGRRGRRWLADVELPADEAELVGLTLRLLDGLEAEIGHAERALAQAVIDDRRVRHLLTIPGVGVQTAVALVAVVGDVQRFPRANRLVSYLGLDPRVRQSGGKPAWIGHISRAGQGHLRGLLIEVAHNAVRTPGPLRAFHARIARRRGSSVATVAVARKLVVLAWHLLTADVDYRWSSASLSAAKLRALGRAAGEGFTRAAPGSVNVREAKARDRERLCAIEDAYLAFVENRQPATDAAAPIGERLVKPGRKARQGSAAESDPRTSALRHGVDRVQRQRTSPSDA